MTDDLDLLYRAMINNLDEETPLLMLIDEYREQGMGWFVTVFEAELELRRLYPHRVREIREITENTILRLGPDGVQRLMKYVEGGP